MPGLLRCGNGWAREGVRVVLNGDAVEVPLDRGCVGIGGNLDAVSVVVYGVGVCRVDMLAGWCKSTIPGYISRPVREGEFISSA